MCLMENFRGLFTHRTNHDCMLVEEERGREGGRGGGRKGGEEEEGGRGRGGRREGRRRRKEGGRGEEEEGREEERNREEGSIQIGLCTKASQPFPPPPPFQTHPPTHPCTTHTCTHTHTHTHTHLPPSHTDDSDVELLSAGGDEPNGDVPVVGTVNTLINSQSSHQPIVHFEGSVREPVSTREYNFTSKDDVKK